ncbi:MULTISPECIES: NAD-dependent epimerase/dehydratase family protein [Bacillus]|uniref:NAD-dependent epimerase/dehydratase family protein n=1 Tax=Bacillus TaxID=1386 RepID=UPI0002D23EE5|nr:MULTISPECIES: NAD-dependent epimerase/dehydratase family protein [Bacillus]MEB9334600.1 NAD-dependent epimerase/dehydratase family protein [Bacillus cereus]ONG62027.1 NAD-dependent epimerase [Bacillus cereus]CCW07763.1 UDP-glucose 4-epimerase [Bacillus sp. GeD10]HDV7169203.1 NAD-dependent epimerase/dehydratase family protein [Bacillus cereus]HEF1857018.1 NAD-dependent epimerase/dehydratase family protein [Bacillus cereus]
MNKKRILITGKESYIGTNFEKWVNNWSNQYDVEKISVRNDGWKQKDFSKYDVVLHVAGIAHVSADPKMEEMYYKINRDLAINIAEKAKKENVKQFIFMSSMIIYGADGKLGESKIITAETEPSPVDFYGRSKLEADLAIQKMNSNNFKTVMVRTPMVYGPNCRGNFPRLKTLAEKSPIFPEISNERSMIFIDNLCEFLKIVIDKELAGIFFPQNKEYVSTKDIINLMAINMNKKVHFIKTFNPVIKIMSKKINVVNKVLGNKAYDKKLNPKFDYCVVDFETSIKISM